MKVWQKAVLVANLPCALVMAVVAWSAGWFLGVLARGGGKTPK